MFVCLFVCLFRCLEEGLLPSLSYRNMSRLYATASLVELTLPPSPPPSSTTPGPPTDHGMACLQAVCRDNKTEENLNNLADDLDAKEYALSPGEAVTHFLFPPHFLFPVQSWLGTSRCTATG